MRMDAPLGREVGNSNEVIASIETLKGRGPRDLEVLSVLLAARMLVVARIEHDDEAAEARVRGAIASGAGVEKFREIIAHQGGDPRVVDDYTRFPAASDRADVRAARAGYVSALRAESIGRAAVALGAGRSRLDDVVDPGVGITVVARPGDRVAAGDPVLAVRHRSGAGLEEALALLSRAVEVSDESPAESSIVVARIAGERR